MRWYGETGPHPDPSPRSRRVAYALRGASQRDADLYVMINGSDEEARFEVQEGSAEDWLGVVDTARPAPDDIRDVGREAPIGSRAVPLRARSIVVLLRR